MKLYPELSKGRYLTVESEIAAAKRSLYFLWWKFLRLSEDYWWLCRFNGKCKDADLSATYAKFGNVFTDDFEMWWIKHGEALFAFQIDPPKVEIFNPWMLDMETDLHYKILIAPKYLTKSEIASQVMYALKDHKPSGLPDRIKNSLSVSDTRGIKKNVLNAVYQVWCLNQVLQNAKEQGKLDRPTRFTQLWIGNQINIMPNAKRKLVVGIKAQLAHQLAVRVKVSRYLAKAQSLIGNVELGKFPVLDSVGSRDRWTKKQQTQITLELAGSRWISPEIDQQKFNKMLGL
jgi:hypothetical protein